MQRMGPWCFCGESLSFLLAGGTEDGGAGGDKGGYQQSFTALARFSSTAIGEELAGELAGLVGDIAVVAEGGATGSDGIVKDFFDGGDEGFDLSGGNAIDALKGMELGKPERFIDVNVAETGDVTLREQTLFESAFCFFPVGEVGGSNGEGVWAEGGEFILFGLFESRVVPQAAEAARVAEADILAVGEGEDDVGVFGDGGYLWEGSRRGRTCLSE